MLELIKNLPKNVAGVRATGNVTKEDVESVLIPALDQLVAETDKIHYLLVLDTEVKNWDIGAWLSDVKVGLKHFTKWTKIAVVTDETGVEKFTDVFSAFVPGSARGFKHSELEAAKAWVSAE